jgi:hypothetical protein
MRGDNGHSTGKESTMDYSRINQKRKLWPESRFRKNAVLICAALIVISLLRMAIA